MATKSLTELESMVGWTSPAFEVPLERGRIRDFAEATFTDDDQYYGATEARANGFEDLPAPVTLFGSLFFVDPDKHEPDIGFDTANTLHGEQAFEFERVPVAGETLYGRTTLSDVYRKDRNNGGRITFAELETTFRDTAGELVLTATKTRMEVLDE